MKRQLLLSIILIGLFSTSYSQNIYWVTSDGAATWAQANSNAPLTGMTATTLAEANANAQAGDVIFMRGGNYFTTINPANSGTSGSPITYQRYMEEDVVFDGIKNCVRLDNAHYIVVDGISCYRTTDNWVIVTNGSTYNTIKNGRFVTAFVWGGIDMRAGTSNTTILNNYFEGTCSRTTPFPGNPPNGQGSDFTKGGPGDFITHASTKYDLIEGNQFILGGTHYAITGESSYCIYRGNTFHASWHGNLNIVPPGSVSRYNVIDNNLFFRSGRDKDTNFCGQPRDREMPPEIQNQVAGSNQQNTILRGNTVIDGGASGFSNWHADILNLKIYSNTFYKNEVNYKMVGTSGTYKYDGEIFMNNILAKAAQYELKTSGPATSGNTICYNNTWNPDGAIIDFGNNDTCSTSNVNIDPVFVNEAAVPIESDLSLQSSSPMIDAGQWLTMITSTSGSGNSFTVSDAGFFIDGFGIVQGDIIQIEGQDTPIRVINADYETNILAVDRIISWTQGIGVALKYSGAKPDMGAYEYIAASVGNQTPYKGTAWNLPGILEAENYDNGGEDIAYKDMSVGNNGGKYRTDDVDIFVAGDVGGGYHVGDIETGEWLEYSINVFNAGSYTLSTRIASSVGNGEYSISIDGVDLTGTVDVPNTGGDQIWQTLSTNSVSLTAGTHTLRLNVISGGFNLNNITVADTQPPTAPTALIVTEVTSGSVSISWTASTDNIGVLVYEIYKDGVLLNTTNTTENTDNKLLVPGKTYSYTVVAKDEAGNASVHSDPVEGATLQFQNITITSIEDKYMDDAPFDVEATVTSGLPLTYEVSGPATISGKTITLDGTTGKVEVTVNQAGDAAYSKTSKTTTFEVILITGIMEDQLPTLKIYPIPATEWIKIEGDYSDSAMARVIDVMGKQVLFQSFKNNSISVSSLPKGVYMLNIIDKGIASKEKIVIHR